MTLNTIANLPTIATIPPNNALIGFNGNAAAFPAKGILLIVLMELFTKLYGAFTIAKRAPEAFCSKKAQIAKTTFQTSPIVMRGLGALTTGGVLSLFDFFKIINSFLMYWNVWEGVSSTGLNQLDQGFVTNVGCSPHTFPFRCVLRI